MKDFSFKNKLATIMFLLSVGSSACAATATASFDFGTGPGKVTAATSGFALTVPPSGSVEHSLDGLILRPGRGQFSNLAFLQGFVGMRASDGYDFIVTAKTTVEAFAGSNNRRWGIHLFADENLQNDGLCAIIIGNNDDKNRLILFRKGLNGEVLASSVFADDGFARGEEYTFSLTGNYVGETSLNLSLTVSDGLNTSTVTTTIDRNDYPGMLTGGSARLREGWAVKFHNFTITIP
jgi:hypothetical protein